TYFYTVTNSRYTAPAPAIDAVVPSSGPAEGGTSISIYGSGFSIGAEVKIGGVNATSSLVVVNSTKITCKTPAGSSGTKEVRVTNPNGQFGTAANGFTYY
ncbi:MAG TPA: IPT/TIG domain-containing protein, partial [Acidobacteriota bacterium]|nr:IPT/TIG domain-containing protein [Acidobacteriota bacterium]